MRSIEYLAQQFPNKTGKELFEIQEKDKAKAQKEYDERNKHKLEFIADINKNGGYYKGTFGLNQYFFYSIYDLRLDNGFMYGTVENITCFNRFIKDTVSIEKDKKTLQDIGNLGISMHERITKEEWDSINEYVENIFPKFWEIIDPKS